MILALYLRFVGPITLDMAILTPWLIAIGLYVPFVPFAALAWIEPDAPVDETVGRGLRWPRRARPADREVVHNRIPLLRADRGISRGELAEALGIHYQTVGYIERGEYAPSLHLALRVARFFGLPVEAVFSLEPFGPLRADALMTRPNVAAD